nr:unnamed protein product [Digitaria exilis]
MSRRFPREIERDSICRVILLWQQASTWTVDSFDESTGTYTSANAHRWCEMRHGSNHRIP